MKQLKIIFDQFAKESGLAEKIKELSIPEIWAEISGESISRVTKVKWFNSGKLCISTNSSTWRAELILRKDDLISEMNKRLGENYIKELVIK